jgi:alkanesulfonate monooxygenase SsuD/methylene tetrahydromethanopterin reductase-like flavin-dependent oxidoreductase (luciferase family)
MMELSLAVQSLCGLTWPAWKQMVEAVERLGFAGLYCTDHFTLPDALTVDSLEVIVALTYLADHTQRIHFGPLVAPFSFRDPVILARQAAVLDDLSGGRMRLGVGAGWMEYEHQMFGYQLGDMATRMARFAEGLEVITQLLQRLSRFPIRVGSTSCARRCSTHGRTVPAGRRSWWAAKVPGGACRWSPAMPAFGTRPGWRPTNFAPARPCSTNWRIRLDEHPARLSAP